MDANGLWVIVQNLCKTVNPNDRPCAAEACPVQRSINAFRCYATVARDSDCYFTRRAMMFLHWLQRPVLYVRSNFDSMWTPYEHLTVDKVHKHSHIVWLKYLVDMITVIVSPEPHQLFSFDTCDSLAKIYLEMIAMRSINTTATCLLSFARVFSTRRVSLKSDNRVMRKTFSLICTELIKYLETITKSAKFNIQKISTDDALRAVSTLAEMSQASTETSTVSSVPSTSSVPPTETSSVPPTETSSVSVEPVEPMEPPTQCVATVLGKRSLESSESDPPPKLQTIPTMSGWIRAGDITFAAKDTIATRPEFTLCSTSNGGISGEINIGELSAQVIGVNNGHLVLQIGSTDSS